MPHRDLPDTPPQAPASPSRRRIFQAAAAVGLGAGLPQADAAGSRHASRHAPKPASSLDAKLKAHVKNVVVIYLENRSFNNLFAKFRAWRRRFRPARRNATAMAPCCRCCRRSGAAWCRDARMWAARIT